ncbi:TetR/AcrR family transcriptional regulator [Rhizobium alvei]|uniref:TetR/AcrR family transcriptional regulator n=1 Tax=Rhizobium alvei TaxID=1132659 RepID=A0ABT8YSS2_9HYPH|nr:TetR/AcrR family transcriptional regulator [Rhizobium alvei]MDO6966734.1 TetR/AcrR family transcriptional regulator [Rhizobium alvei]
MQTATSRRNLPAEERRRTMLLAALDLFSERGLAITVQQLADRVKVTQPLVHRYFPTKSDLIEAILELIQRGHWQPEWGERLAERDRPLAERLQEFYASYLPAIYRIQWYRGFLFAALDDSGFAQTYLEQFHSEILVTIAEELRANFGYPSLAEVGLFERETEMIYAMHSTAIFIGLRRYVYETPVIKDVAPVIRDQIRATLFLAPEVLEELMPGKKRLAG